MVATRIKKKKSVKSDKSEPELPQKPVVKQVVEEVLEEGQMPEVLEEIKEDARDIEKAVEKIEDSQVATDTPVANSSLVSDAPEFLTKEKLGEESEIQDKMKEESKKEVVNELFRPKRVDIMPEFIDSSDRKKRSPVLWAVLMIAVALVTGGTLLVLVKKMPRVPSFTAKPTPTSAPTLTPAPVAPSRSDIKIQVLNGGGVVGAGSKMKKFLEGKGYTVADVGNSSDFTYETTSILAKSDKEASLQLLKSDLESDYTIGTVAATLTSDVYDVQVIVGKK